MNWPDPSVELLPHISIRVRRGFGCGCGETYQPWRRLRDRTGRGSDRTFTCLLTGRPVFLKSIAEKCYFHLWERMRGIYSIEECFPLLDMKETIRLCSSLGLEHPTRRELQEPLVLNFLIRERLPDGKTSLHARCLGFKDGLQPSLFDVSFQVCQRLGIDWRLVDPTALNQQFLAGLRFARKGAMDMTAELSELAGAFTVTFARWYAPSATLETLVAQCAESMKIPRSKCLTLFRAAVWTGAIPVDFARELRMDRPVSRRIDASKS